MYMLYVELPPPLPGNFFLPDCHSYLRFFFFGAPGGGGGGGGIHADNI